MHQFTMMEYLNACKSRARFLQLGLACDPWLFHKALSITSLHYQLLLLKAIIGFISSYLSNTIIVVIGKNKLREVVQPGC